MARNCFSTGAPACCHIYYLLTGNNSKFNGFSDNFASMHTALALHNTHTYIAICVEFFIIYIVRSDELENFGPNDWKQWSVCVCWNKVHAYSSKTLARSRKIDVIVCIENNVLLLSVSIYLNTANIRRKRLCTQNFEKLKLAPEPMNLRSGDNKFTCCVLLPMAMFITISD